MLEKLFSLRENQTTVQTEIVAGFTTFLAMAYIVFVNPNILSTTGMDKGAVIVSTCLAAAFGCLVMAFWANWPVGTAPGMGLNAFFAFTVVQGMGWSWQAALGAVFISGAIFVLLTATGVRRWIVNAIPESLQVAIPAGCLLYTSDAADGGLAQHLGAAGSHWLFHNRFTGLFQNSRCDFVWYFGGNRFGSLCRPQYSNASGSHVIAPKHQAYVHAVRCRASLE